MELDFFIKSKAIVPNDSFDDMYASGIDVRNKEGLYNISDVFLKHVSSVRKIGHFDWVSKFKGNVISVNNGNFDAYLIESFDEFVKKINKPCFKVTFEYESIFDDNIGLSEGVIFDDIDELIEISNNVTSVSIGNIVYHVSESINSLFTRYQKFEKTKLLQNFNIN